MRGLRKSFPDLIGAVLLVALGAAFAVGSTNFELFGPGGRISPGFMPFVAGVLLMVFGGLVGGGAMWRLGRSSQKTEEQVPEQRQKNEQEQARGTSKGGTRAVTDVFGLTLIAILLVPVLGFSLSLGLLVFTLATVVEREGLLLGLVLSIGGVIITWLLFDQLLQVPLPQGLFETVIGG